MNLDEFYKLSFKKKKEFIKNNPDYFYLGIGNKKLYHFIKTIEYLNCSNDRLFDIAKQIRKSLLAESNKNYLNYINKWNDICFLLLNRNADRNLFNFIIQLYNDFHKKFNYYLNLTIPIRNWCPNLSDEDLAYYLSLVRDHRLTVTDLCLRKFCSIESFKRIYKIYNLDIARMAWTKLTDSHYDFLFDKEEFVLKFILVLKNIIRWDTLNAKYFYLVYEKFKPKINNFRHIEDIRKTSSYIENIIFT